MNSEFVKYKLPVNWENGMMIKQDHLLELNEYINSIKQNSILNSLNPYNYGILPSFNERFENIKLISESQGNNVFLSVNKCRLITFDGMYLDINPETKKNKYFEDEALSVSIDLNNSNYNYALVYFTYSLEDMVKVGSIDIDKDDFERKSNINHSIKLTYSFLENKSDISNKFDFQANSFPIALINIANKENPTIDENYIPPSVNFYSHNLLSDKYAEITRNMQEIIESANRIRSFINSDLKKARVSELTIDLNMIYGSLIPIIVEINANLKTSYKMKSPIEMLALFKKLSLAFSSSIHSLLPERRREVGDYFAAQYGTPSDLARIGANLIESNYSHSNISDSTIVPILEFVNTLKALFNKIAEKGLGTKVFGQEDTFKEERNPETNIKSDTGLFDSML